MNPYLAGIGLGLVLLAAFVVMGRGLGASGAFVFGLRRRSSTRWLRPTPRATRSGRSTSRPASATRSRSGWSSRCSACSSAASSPGCSPAACAGCVEKGPRISTRGRFALAFVGGALMGVGAKLARGCTSGQALTGGALLSAGGWVFMMLCLRRRLRRGLVRSKGSGYERPLLQVRRLRRRDVARRRLRHRHRLRLLPRAGRLRLAPGSSPPSSTSGHGGLPRDVHRDRHRDARALLPRLARRRRPLAGLRLADLLWRRRSSAACCSASASSSAATARAPRWSRSPPASSTPSSSCSASSSASSRSARPGRRSLGFAESIDARPPDAARGARPAVRPRGLAGRADGARRLRRGGSLEKKLRRPPAGRTHERGGLWSGRPLPQRLALCSASLSASAPSLIGDPTTRGRVTLDSAELAAIVEGEVDHVSRTSSPTGSIAGRQDFRLDRPAPRGRLRGLPHPRRERLAITDLPDAELPRNEKIVLYSAEGIHSAQAWMLFKAKQYPAVYILVDGLKQLEGAGALPGRIPPRPPRRRSGSPSRRPPSAPRHFGGTLARPPRPARVRGARPGRAARGAGGRRPSRPQARRRPARRRRKAADSVETGR